MLTKYKVDEANAILNKFEENNLTSNNIETIKSALEVLNNESGKRGNKERFGKSKNALDNEILEKLVDDLLKENERITDALKSDDRMKQDDLSDQDYIDMMDADADIDIWSVMNNTLSSEQKRDIFNIVKDKNLSKKEYEKVLIEETEKLLVDGYKTTGYRNIQSPDRLAKNIRSRLYRYKTR